MILRATKALPISRNGYDIEHLEVGQIIETDDVLGSLLINAGVVEPVEVKVDQPMETKAIVEVGKKPRSRKGKQ